MPVPAHPDATLDYVVPLGGTDGPAAWSEDTTPIPLAGDAPAKPATAPKQVIKLTQLGDFRLVAKLGQGGMGTVFKAEQVSKKRLVALKVLNKELTAKPGYVQRFQREARAMGKLAHPNLVRCYAAGDQYGFVYLAMEYVDGGSLQDKLKVGPLPVAAAVTLAIDLAHGLHAAHEVGLVHRDVKPDNVLLTKTGVPKLTDLGLAKAADEESSDLTRTGIGIGTPLFASPEQIRDAKTVDARSDLYSLGCVLYACLVGRPPFESESLIGIVTAKEKGAYTPAGVARPGVPPALDRVLSKLLAKHPDHRYASAAEVAQELTWSGLAAAPPE